MYIIAVYDVSEKRVAKMLKLCRRYLNWIQNSVFEGELTELQLRKFEYEARELLVLKEDSLIIFKSREERWLEKQIIGMEKNKIDNFL
jgi:CRISPR-associated protein Cas2